MQRYGDIVFRDDAAISVPLRSTVARAEPAPRSGDSPRERTDPRPDPAGDTRITRFSACGRHRALLVLGHGTGSGIEVPDLEALGDAAHERERVVQRPVGPEDGH